TCHIVRLRPRHVVGNSGKAKAVVVAPESRPEPEAVRGAAKAGSHAKGAAPEYPVRGRVPGSLWIIQILAPLPHVAMHVVQPQLVRGIRTNLRRATQVRTLLALAEWSVTVEIGLCGREVVG